MRCAQFVVLSCADNSFNIMIAGRITFIALFISCCGHLETIPLRSVLINVLANNPLVVFATQTTGEVLDSVVDTIIHVPTVIAKAVGANYNFPTLLGHTNVVDYTDKLLAEYYSHADNEDVKLSIDKLILKYGFPLEIHPVQTEDGYNLNMFRIPNNGSVIFLMHGILGSADDFVVSGPENGLAYLLANEGYDVWMGNARGSKHSRSHAYLTPADSEFWDFSWHEIGCYDLPAMIDYVLRTSNSETLKYIGHSQGTTVFFVMAAERPEYNDKIGFMIALSPVAYMTHVKSPIIRFLAPGGPLLFITSKVLGIHEFFPDNILTRWTKSLTCASGALAEIICQNAVFLVAGFAFEQLNMTTLAVLLGHAPSGASAKQFAHFGQGVISGEFRQYDFGAIENVERYGQRNPPRYSLDRIKIPISLFYSDEDWLASPKDVENLYNKLYNAVDIYKVQYKPFNHLDFLFAKDFKSLIYKRLRKLLTLF